MSTEATMTVLRLDSDELEHDMGWVFYDGVLFTGVAFERWPSGQLRSESTYEAGYRHGPERTWFPSGHLESEGEFFHGAVHGVRRRWSEDGQLKCVERFDHGVFVAAEKVVEGTVPALEG